MALKIICGIGGKGSVFMINIEPLSLKPSHLWSQYK